MRYTCSIWIIWLLSCASAWGQEVLENNPPSVKFYKINTPHFKVLYPRGFGTEAQRVANVLEHIYEPEAQSLRVRPRKIPIILQNQTSISNGFVTLLPRRSEFYTMPPQDYNSLGTTDWLNHLAAHEYRHVAQYKLANSGFNRALYVAFGPATMAAMYSMSVPQWMREGDAVATETAFTRSGRGRIPNFDLVLRTNLQEGRVFSYNKQHLRSYKHNISDHYVLGYHMISYLRKRTNDPDIWSNIVKRTTYAPFLPFWFSSSVKKYSGLNLPQLYKATVADLQQTWSEELKDVTFTAFETVTQRNKSSYTDYLYPQPVSMGGLLVLKQGIGDFAQFTLWKDGKERNVFIPGVINDAGMLSASGNKIVWSEHGFDPRWRVKNYSVIKSYDVETKQYKVLTHKTRYSGAALSPDGSKIVTIESATDYKASIVVIDDEDGSLIKKFEGPDQAFYSMARWSTDGKKIVALKTMNNQRSIVAIDYSSGVFTTLIAPSEENIGHPVLIGNYLLFNSPVSGVDNIYALDLERQVTLQVTSAKYGAYNAVVSADGSTLYYNNQSRDGLDVVSIPFEPASWLIFNRKPQPKKYYHYLSEQEGHSNLFDSIPNQLYASERYSKLSGIFNPISWGAYFNSSFTQADIGIASQDILSTTTIKAGYLFDINERTGAWHVGASYQGWYPIIDVDVKYAKRSVDEGYIRYDKVVGSDTLENVVEKLLLDWEETTVETGLRIPLITTNSKYHGNFSIANYVGYTHITNFTNSIDGGGRLFPSNYPQFFLRSYLDNGSLLYNRFNMSAYRLLKQSRRDINSKFGQAFNLTWYSTPYGGDFSGKQFSFYTQLYFPGLFKHHSLWGYWAFQSTDISQVYRNRDFGRDNYIFGNHIPLPRGLSVFRYEKFYSMSANYTLPLWYPDVALGPLVNIQRFRGNAFIDYGFGSSPKFDSSQTYVSVGAELRMDFNLMRYLPQLNIGFRYAHGLQPAASQFELLIGFLNF